MPKVLQRIRSVIFVLAGLVIAAAEWIEVQYANNPFGFNSNTYQTFAQDCLLAYYTLGFIGLALLITQARQQRHWLGWLGVAFALLGTLLGIAEAVKYPEAGSDGNFFIILATISVSLFDLGLVFWALDLPNTTRGYLFQKLAMSGLALMTQVTQSIIQVIILLQRENGTISTATPLYLSQGILYGVFWTILGISTWQTQETTDTTIPKTPAQSFADSSFEIQISPLPPTNNADR
jgi:hypothetical protein